MGTKTKAKQAEKRVLAKVQRADSLLRKSGNHKQALAVKKERRDAKKAVIDKALLATKEVQKGPMRKAAAPN